MNKKGTGTLASVKLISIVLISSLVAGPVHAASGQVTRTSGENRYATAAQVAKANWAYGTKDVVLVTGEGYADAVSASSLAKKLNAPILLTNSRELNVDAKSALDTLRPNNIYIIGGNASIGQGVRNTLKNYGYNLIELQGENRYETNVAVAKKLVELGVNPSSVLLVGGEGFSDALSVAPVAAAKEQILLLGNNDADSMRSVINFVKTNNSKVTVVGTTNVISDYMYNALGAVDRVNGGDTRFETNINVLNKFDSYLKSDKLFVANASGDGYADALVASALAGKTASPLVLVNDYGTTVTNNAISYISRKASKTTDINVIGGTGVVPESILYNINKVVNPSNSGNNSSSVQSIEAVSLNQIKVHFNTSVDEDSAEDVTNYKIDGTQLTKLDNDVAKDENGANAKKIDDNTVLITLAHSVKQYSNVTVTVKKSILTQDKYSTIDGFEQTVTFSDTTVPTLQNVSVEGNSQLTVEFSEAVNMKSINELKGKFKIDGRSLGNYGINTQYSEIKDCVKVNNTSYGPTGTWANKVTFYLDSAIENGNHTLTVSDGDSYGLLGDAAGFTFKETTRDFYVDKMTSKPQIRSIKEVSSGKVHITFDRPMDIQTAKELSNYEINGKKLSSISGAYIELDDNDTVVKLKHISDGTIKTGSNTVYISNRVRDAFGNKVSDDTRMNFDDIKDETKPKINSVTVVDSETICIRFSKDVEYYYATNISNYKLKDNKDIDITNHIRGIYSTSGESDTGNTDTYNIKLKKYNPNNSNDDWRLTGSKYTLTVKNIIDTSSTPNTMEDYTYTINGNDDIHPKGVGIYAKLRNDSGSSRDKVIIYFSEPMDTAALTDRNNFKFINGEGDTKQLPSNTDISVGGDDKSAILEFPSNYHVKTTGRTVYGSANDVTAVSVFNVKDRSGNILDGVAYNNDNKIDTSLSGAQVKDKTLRVYYNGDDLKADVQFDKAIEEVTPSDFTLGGIKPTTANPHGDKVTLTFKEGAKASYDERAAYPLTYANGKVNTDPTKIELIKAQGPNARLQIVSTGTIDETGGKVSRDKNGNVIDLSYDQGKIYNYEAGPRTTCSNESEADYWTVTKNEDGGKAYITFDTMLDPSSGIKTDDFTFISNNGTDIRPDSVRVEGTTLIFSFNKDNRDYKAFDGSTLDIRAKSSISLRTTKDGDGNYAEYSPSSDDLRKRTVTITGDTQAPTLKQMTATATANRAIDLSQYFIDNVTTAKSLTYKVNGMVIKGNRYIPIAAGMLKVTATDAANNTSDELTITVNAAGQDGTVDLSTIKVNTESVPFATIVTFQINAADPENYTVKLKGVDAKFYPSTKTFGTALDGTYTEAQFTAADFVVTKKTTTTVPNLDGVNLVDAAGIANNGKTQFVLRGVIKVNPLDTFKFTISKTGNVVPTPNISDNLSAWTTVTDGNTVAVANGTHIGIAEVDANGKVVKFIDKIAVVKDYVAARAGSAIATNPPDLTTLMASKTGSIIIKVDGTDAAHTFTLPLDNHSAFSDVNALATTIGSSVNNSYMPLNNVANVRIVDGKIVITSKTIGTSSTVAVTATGTNSADVLKLIGFTGSETGTGVTEAN